VHTRAIHTWTAWTIYTGSLIDPDENLFESDRQATGGFALESLMVQTKSWTKGNEGVRVLVADSNPMAGRLVAHALGRDRGLAVKDATGSPVVPMASLLTPDVAIISGNLEGIRGRGFEILKQLRAAVSTTRTIMLLDSSECNLVVEAFGCGARGIFSRHDPLKMLSRCVHKVHEGQLWINAAQLEFLLETLAEAPATHLVDYHGTALLSRREQDVVRWLVEGLTNRAIGIELKISENTVKNYLLRIFDKLGVSSRVEVVIYAANQRAANRTPDMQQLETP
jgi:DNA-binding NarL/FixJ family response regulator